jgi:hypothetical protein
MAITTTGVVPEASDPTIISFKTPRQGVKPNIHLSFEYLPNKNISSITLKLTNFYSEINIAQYRYLKVIAGYNNGPVCEIDCEIFNCYVERPNPEGITVFSGVIGTVSDYLNSKEGIKYTLDKPLVSDALSAIASSANLTSKIQLPEDWKSVKIPVTATYTYTNALTMRDALANQLSSISHNLGISRLSISVKSGVLIAKGMNAGSSEESTVILDKVSTAYLMGGHVVVKAPWNPLITADTIFQMDSRYFRGRMGSLFVSGEKKKFQLFHIIVNFSTQNENDMELEAIDTSIGG